MKNNFKKVISVLSAAAILTALAVPSVFADGTALDAVNAADADTIAAAVASVVTESGKFDYSVLPSCDQNEINERMLSGIPYADNDALYAAYQTALENTTQVDRALYKPELIEDFSNLDSGWTQSNPVPYIGSPGKIDTNILRNLNISGNETSFMEVWGAPFGEGGNQYISRVLGNPYCIVSGYMYYSNINNMPKVYYGIEGSSRNYYIGNGGTDGAYRYNNGSQWISDIAENDNAWHKVVFDGLTAPGKIKGYFDGQLLFTAEDTMTTLKVGCLDTINDGFYIFCLDNISIAVSKPAEELLESFNENPVTEESLSGILAAINKDRALFESLPECDRKAIASDTEKGRPYDNADALADAYQTALEKATGVDEDKYTVLWTEDFSNYSNDDWTASGSLRGNAIGSELLSGIGDQSRQSINISGEKCSAGFVGASLAGTPGDVNYITRSVDEENSVVTAYFYDMMNDGNARYNIKVNDNTWVGRSDSGDKYTYAAGGAVAASNIQTGKGWHKVVFDAATNSELMNIYLDGVLIAQSSEKVKYVQLGNQWVDEGYDIVWMDNISVAAEKKTERLTIKKGLTEIDTLPSSGSIRICFWEHSFPVRLRHSMMFVHIGHRMR
ncbi:MAG: hypothetical protein ACI4DP_01635 [Candidatus Ornithomonoglobus sp.]